MKRRLLCFAITLILFITNILPCIGANDFETAEDSLINANMFIYEKMAYIDYYKLQINEMKLNRGLAKQGTDAFSNRPVFVYGDQEKASKESTTSGRPIARNVNGIKEYRALGYAIDSSVFPNPSFPSDNEGYLATDKKWIKEPWGMGSIKDVYDKNGKSEKINILGTPLEYIKKWIRWNDFKPNDVEAYTGKRNYFVENAVDVPEALKDNFEDFLYIIQPPTEHSWGLGIAFYYWNGYYNLNYRTFLIKPFDMVGGDLSVNFCELPGSITEGKEVTVVIRIKSNFDDDLEDMDFKWNIRKSDGTPLNAKDDGLVFKELSDVKSGKLNIPSSKKQTKVFSKFTMPDSNVIVEFEINKDGENPIENDTENNVVSTVVEVVKPLKSKVEEFELPYYALSRDINFPLAGGEKLVASLKKRSHSWWDGRTTGELNISNENKELFYKYSIKDSPHVGHDETEVIRKPIIEAVINRINFGDNPLGEKWFNSGNLYDIISRTAKISYEGSVSKPYYYLEPCNDESCKVENCPGHRQNGWANSSFPSNTDEMKLAVKVYNGKEKLQKKDLRNEIANNGEGFMCSMLWPNTAIKFDVIRYMCHLDNNGKEKVDSWTAVSGRYKREFVQQCSADITWDVSSSRLMSDDYKQSREAARYMKYDQAYYDRAVFASDRNLQDYDYPIKSGYYLNPTGTYTFKVKTVTYKETDEKTNLEISTLVGWMSLLY